MDKDKANPNEKDSCDRLPGKDSEIVYVGSHPHEAEDSEETVQKWKPLKFVKEAFDETKEKLFPPRRG